MLPILFAGFKFYVYFSRRERKKHYNDQFGLFETYFWYSHTREKAATPRGKMQLDVTTLQKYVNKTHTNMTKADRIKIVVPLQQDTNFQQLIIQKEVMSHTPSKGVWKYRHDEINLTITLQEKTSIIPQTGLMLHKSIAFEFTSKIEMITFVLCSNAFIMIFLNTGEG